MLMLVVFSVGCEVLNTELGHEDHDHDGDGVQDHAAEDHNKDECTDHGGKWVEEHEECENISEKDCKEIGGEFNECASACRNDPDAEICTLQCVPLCSFEEAHHDDEDHHDEEEDHNEEIK